MGKFEATMITSPYAVDRILVDGAKVGFSMASDLVTGGLLRVLAASKPAGKFLELGTGTGHGAAWLLDGMDNRSTLLAVEQDERALDVAQRHLGNDRRIQFRLGDGGVLLESLQDQAGTFDLIFADTWPGKYTHLKEVLALLKLGGIYIIDDMLPQPNWPAEHPAKVDWLVDTLENRSDLQITKLHWSTGVMIGVKI